MFKELTNEMLDLVVVEKGHRAARFAMLLGGDACCCVIIACCSRGGRGGRGK